MAERAMWTREELLKILPHASTFMFLARAWVDENNQINAFLDMDVAAPFFAAHFPGRTYQPADPVFPGALLIETAAEVCCLFEAEELAAGRLPAFREVENFKWGKPVKPGEEVLIVACDLGQRYGIRQFYVEVVSNGERVARGTISAVFAPA